ncbi:4Fe-4S binding protein [bacterium]|nr:4Fe-4S binding protein [bacterium]
MTDLYEQLREKLHQLSVGFPKTESGVEIKILKKMFDRDDAELFLEMTPFIQKLGTIAKKTGRDPAETARLLEKMAEKGLIFRLRRGDNSMYAASAFVVGSFEYQLKRMDKELAELVEQYFNEGFLADGIASSIAPLRTIPVHHSIEGSMRVAPHSDAREILKSKDKIALADCICRTQQKLIEKECDKPLDVCFVFGSHAQYYVDNGMARFVAMDEALNALDRAEKAGLVVQPASSVNPGGMCNCCGDCCGILRALNLLPNPAEMVYNDYWAEIDTDECTGCETCMDRCQVAAIKMNQEEKSQIDYDRCIGCGLCVTTCPSEAIKLVLKPEEKRLPVFLTNREMMEATMEKRGITELL